MRTGTVEANLAVLNDTFRLPHVADLIAAKLAGPERATLAAADVAFHAAEYARLRGELEAASAASALPETATAKPALHDLLLRLAVGGRGPLTRRSGFALVGSEAWVYSRGMTADTFRDILRRAPFEPFRVEMSCGESYNVMHPEMALVSAKTLVLALPEPTRPDGERLVFCSYIHVAHVEVLEPSRAA